MSEPRHRKLLALGIASLVSTGRSEVLERVPNEIFNLWTDVLYEVRESRNHTQDGEDGLVLDKRRRCHLIRCVYQRPQSSLGRRQCPSIVLRRV